MTIHEAVFSVWRQLLLTALYLLLTGQMVLITAAFRDKRTRRTKGVLIAAFLIGVAALWPCMAMIAWENNFHSGFEGLPGWLSAVGALPARALVLFEALLAVFVAMAARDARRYRREHLTPDSVKQAMDRLPVGVAFADAGGGVIFRNLVMDQLSRSLTGKLFTDLGAFRAAVGGDQVAAEGKIWQLRFRETPGSGLTQLTATDITEEADVLADLEVNNKKLKDIQLRLRIYNRQAERIVAAQELLSARMAVHDQLGSVLLESRHLMTDPASIDEGLLLRALKNANTYLLREYEGDDTAVDPLTEAVGMAQAIGVRVELTGIPPAADRPRAVLAAAIRECAANTVKHADGDRLMVDARRAGGRYTFVLRGSGRPPAEPIRETGGLLSLRAMAQRHGGTMTAGADPDFRLTLTLPDEGDTA